MSAHFIPKEKIVRHCKKKRCALKNLRTLPSPHARALPIGFRVRLCRASARTSQKLFWCEGGNDLFEAWIAAQRVPKRHEFQLAVTDRGWATAQIRKLFTGEVLVTRPRSNHRQIPDHGDATECILFNRKQNKGTLAF